MHKKIKKITKKAQKVQKGRTLWIIGGRGFGAFLAKFSKQRVVKNRQKDSVLPGPRKWPKMTFFRDFLTFYKNKKYINYYEIKFIIASRSAEHSGIADSRHERGKRGPVLPAPASTNIVT